MKRETNRIYFLENPYPNGHKIARFMWSGRMDEDETLWFDFHLETDDHYVEDESEASLKEPESDWKAKNVWENYHKYKISSTYWGEENKGIKIDTNSEKLNFEKYLQKELIVDKLPLARGFDHQDLAFNIYLLGHDSCGNHKIIFNKNKNRYDVKWTGKIALTYSGNYNFDHDFIVEIQNVKFEGFRFPKSWTLEKAEEIFRRKIEDLEDYEFIDLNPKSNRREYRLIRIEY